VLIADLAGDAFRVEDLYDRALPWMQHWLCLLLEQPSPPVGEIRRALAALQRVAKLVDAQPDPRLVQRAAVAATRRPVHR
jgi:hypothetical protein